jgi:hypothetical protein
VPCDDGRVTGPRQPRFLFGSNLEKHQASMDRLHRRLAHISSQRANAIDFVWAHAVQEWLPALLASLRQFLAWLPPERRAWFSTADELLRERQ